MSFDDYLGYDSLSQDQKSQLDEEEKQLLDKYDNVLNLSKKVRANNTELKMGSPHIRDELTPGHHLTRSQLNVIKDFLNQWDQKVQFTITEQDKRREEESNRIMANIGRVKNLVKSVSLEGLSSNATTLSNEAKELLGLSSTLFSDEDTIRAHLKDLTDDQVKEFESALHAFQNLYNKFVTLSNQVNKEINASADASGLAIPSIVDTVQGLANGLLGRKMSKMMKSKSKSKKSKSKSKSKMMKRSNSKSKKSKSKKMKRSNPKSKKACDAANMLMVPAKRKGSRKHKAYCRKKSNSKQ